MSDKIIKELKDLDKRLDVIEGRLNNSTNTNARIRDRIKGLSDRISEIETQMGIA